MLAADVLNQTLIDPWVQKAKLGETVDANMFRFGSRNPGGNSGDITNAIYDIAIKDKEMNILSRSGNIDKFLAKGGLRGSGSSIESYTKIFEEGMNQGLFSDIVDVGDNNLTSKIEEKMKAIGEGVKTMMEKFDMDVTQATEIMGKAKRKAGISEEQFSGIIGASDKLGALAGLSSGETISTFMQAGTQAVQRGTGTGMGAGLQAVRDIETLRQLQSTGMINSHDVASVGGGQGAWKIGAELKEHPIIKSIKQQAYIAYGKDSGGKIDELLSPDKDLSMNEVLDIISDDIKHAEKIDKGAVLDRQISMIGPDSSIVLEPLNLNDGAILVRSADKALMSLEGDIGDRYRKHSAEALTGETAEDRAESEQLAHDIMKTYVHSNYGKLGSDMVTMKAKLLAPKTLKSKAESLRMEANLLATKLGFTSASEVELWGEISPTERREGKLRSEHMFWANRTFQSTAIKDGDLMSADYLRGRGGTDYSLIKDTDVDIAYLSSLAKSGVPISDPRVQKELDDIGPDGKINKSARELAVKAYGNLDAIEGVARYVTMERRNDGTDALLKASESLEKAASDLSDINKRLDAAEKASKEANARNSERKKGTTGGGGGDW
jgi:hypothetical protein